MVDDTGAVPYVDASTLRAAVEQMQGTAGPFLKIWFTLKAMGLSDTKSVSIDTSNSTESLSRLFGYGGRDFFVPFAHTNRYLSMKSDASRSVIQTNIRQWHDGTGTKDPTHLLDVRSDEASGRLQVGLQRSYPHGLGTNENGFAARDGSRVTVPEIAWAVWYGRATEIPESVDPETFLVALMRDELSVSAAEAANIFVAQDLVITVQATRLTDDELQAIVVSALGASFEVREQPDDAELNWRRVSLTRTISDKPAWMLAPAKQQLETLLAEGSTAVLLSGPPRTGKSMTVRQVVGPNVEFIQIHDGWTYANLIVGQTIADGNITWEPGPLLQALRDGVKYIVLEEANRTRLSQALGEVFSLLEPDYRGEDNALPLPDGSTIFIPQDTCFLFTINTIDRSTEDLDDALYGRLKVVDFEPRIETLSEILALKGIPVDRGDALKSFFSEVQRDYALGHGYFSSLNEDSDLGLFYLSTIRPVLANHFEAYAPETLDRIDTAYDEIVMQAIA